MPNIALQQVSAGRPAKVSKLKADPIFDVIIRHKIAAHEHDSAVGLYQMLEGKLAEDDPRYIAATKSVSKASDAMDEIAFEMLQIIPTSWDGIAALLTWAADFPEKHCGWPERTPGKNGDHRTWENVMHRNLAKAVGKIAKESGNVQAAINRN